MLAVSDFSTVAVLLVVLIAMVAVIMVLTHVIGPRRVGPVKDSPYESGVDPIGDTRRRFNVRFYLVAVLFLVFDVEIVFLYPWAVLFPRLNDAAHQAWAGELAAQGYGVAFLGVNILIFFALLTVGFIYEWRKGVFRWD